MKTQYRHRVAALEGHSAAVDRPPYISVSDESEITPAMESMGVKIYVGFSPDDWDTPEEPNR